MAYISLYRKYRSRDFDDLVGQDHITTTLKNAIIRNRIGHAYLFSGPRGTGKTSTARIFAKALNCLSSDGPTPSPCNECDACTAIATDSMFDVIEIDAASNRGIDDIRDLREKVRVPPAQARYKVYIIDEVHMLTKDASNGLLKTLEEPPPKVVFLLATTEPQKLLSTILSRCQRYDFRRLTDSEIAGHLTNIASREGFTIEDEALNTIVKAADGSMRDSISLLDQLVSFSDGQVLAKDVNEVFGLVEKKEIGNFMNAVFSGDTATTFSLFNGFFQAGKSFSLFIRLLLEYIRDLYLIKQKIKPSSTTYTDSDIKVLRRQAGAVSRGALVAMLDELARVEDRIRWETYPRIILEVMVVKLLDMVAGPGLIGDVAPGTTTDVKDTAVPPTPAGKKTTPSPAPARKPAPEPKPESPAPAPAKAPTPPARQDEPDFSEEPLPPEPKPAPAPPKTSGGDPRMMPVPDINDDQFPPVEDDDFIFEDVDDPDLNNIRKNWKNILSEVRGINLTAYFQLKKGVPATLDDGMVALVFDPRHEFQRIKSLDAQNAKSLEKAMDKVLGTDYRINVVSSADKDKKKPVESGGGLELEVQKTESGPEKPPVKTEENKKKKKSGGPHLADLFEEIFPDSKEIS